MFLGEGLAEIATRGEGEGGQYQECERWEMTHTPGPWHTVDSTFGNIFVESSSDGSVCKVAQKKNMVANAQLITAAPDLLEALRVMVDHASEKYPHFEAERGTKDIQQALDAIAKAEGRS